MTEVSGVDKTGISAHRAKIRVLAYLGLLIAVIAGIVLAASGPGYRFGWWTLPTGFRMFQYGMFIGLGGVGVGTVALVLAWLAKASSGKVIAIGAIIIGLLTAYVPNHWINVAQSVPPIHDITTDLDNPPAFDVLATTRSENENPVAYNTDDIEQQRGAYPGVTPLQTTIAPDAVFTALMEAVADTNWEIAAIDAENMVIEATDQTFWFGFKDDVILRVTPTAAGSRVDMRSQSRIGGGDAGTNARRVSQFLAAFQDRLR